MNAGIERMMNSENLGTRITENRTLDRKIWALEALKSKIVFLGGSGGICGILSGRKALTRKNGGSCGVWKIFGDFWSVWSGLGPICNYFLEAEGPTGLFANICGPRRHIGQVQAVLRNFVRI
jgi:hypothetical protein